MQLRKDIEKLIQGINQLMYDKDKVIKQFLIGIICNDHILLEDVPGTGKTLLTNTMAEILQLKFRRIQGTPDLLPGDITGVNIYNPKKGEFQFQPGPIFTNILLFDEINRTSPKTQSALLEAMSENQVTIDNTTYKIDKPFFVIATQNPIEHTGTYPLPQAQLDRFFLRAKMGYPRPEFEKKIIMNEFEDVQLPRLDPQTLNKWQNDYKQVFISEKIIDKLLSIVNKTRTQANFSLGISPRASKKFVKAVKASAYIHNRDYVIRDDILNLFLPVMVHRVEAETPGEEKILLEELLHSANF